MQDNIKKSDFCSYGKCNFRKTHQCVDWLANGLQVLFQIEVAFRLAVHLRHLKAQKLVGQIELR